MRLPERIQYGSIGIFQRARKGEFLLAKHQALTSPLTRQHPITATMRIDGGIFALTKP